MARRPIGRLPTGAARSLGRGDVVTSVITARLPDVVILEPTQFNEARHAEAGLASRFVQDDIAYPGPGVLRGLHYLSPNARTELINHDLPIATFGRLTPRD